MGASAPARVRTNGQVRATAGSATLPLSLPKRKYSCPRFFDWGDRSRGAQAAAARADASTCFSTPHYLPADRAHATGTAAAARSGLKWARARAAPAKSPRSNRGGDGTTVLRKAQEAVAHPRAETELYV